MTALTTGISLRVAAAAQTKADMKPSFTPCVFSKACSQQVRGNRCEWTRDEATVVVIVIGRFRVTNESAYVGVHGPDRSMRRHNVACAAREAVRMEGQRRRNSA